MTGSGRGYLGSSSLELGVGVLVAASAVERIYSELTPYAPTSMV